MMRRITLDIIVGDTIYGRTLLIDDSTERVTMRLDVVGPLFTMSVAEQAAYQAGRADANQEPR